MALIDRAAIQKTDQAAVVEVARAARAHHRAAGVAVGDRAEIDADEAARVVAGRDNAARRRGGDACAGLRLTDQAASGAGAIDIPERKAAANGAGVVANQAAIEAEVCPRHRARGRAIHDGGGGLGDTNEASGVPVDPDHGAFARTVGNGAGVVADETAGISARAGHSAERRAVCDGGAVLRRAHQAADVILAADDAGGVAAGDSAASAQEPDETAVVKVAPAARTHNSPAGVAVRDQTKVDADQSASVIAGGDDAGGGRVADDRGQFRLTDQAAGRARAEDTTRRAAPGDGAVVVTDQAAVKTEVCARNRTRGRRCADARGALGDANQTAGVAVRSGHPATGPTPRDRASVVAHKAANIRRATDRAGRVTVGDGGSALCIAHQPANLELTAYSANRVAPGDCAAALHPDETARIESARARADDLTARVAVRDRAVIDADEAASVIASRYSSARR